MIDINIRKEIEKDYEMSEFVVEEAFKNGVSSQHKEKYVVQKLRKSDRFIPELSLVAEFDGNIVAYIMYTKLIIKNDVNEYESLLLAPIAVLPEYQNKGISTKLIFESFKIAKENGFKSVIVLEHEIFYSRFGFKPASKWGIKTIFDISDDSLMALQLEDKSLDNI